MAEISAISFNSVHVSIVLDSVKDRKGRLQPGSRGGWAVGTIYTYLYILHLLASSSHLNAYAHVCIGKTDVGIGH